MKLSINRQNRPANKMRAATVIILTIVALFAFGAALESDTNDDVEWTINVNNESPIDDPETDDLDIPGDDGKSTRKRRSTCGLPYELSEEGKQLVVDEHNRLRGLEGSSNMLAMEWSDDLARRAHQWASQCIWNHGMMTDCDGYTIGQNLYMATGGSGSKDVDLTHVISSAWYSEKDFYNFSNNTCRYKLCGHYEQIVKAKSNQVGCSVAHCPVVMNGLKPWYNAVIVACDYRYKPIDGLRFPYMKGTACSQCIKTVDLAYTCKNKLCYECDPTKTTNCVCDTLNCARGTFSASACKCICPAGYWGPLCKKPCKCSDVYSNCAMFKSDCSAPYFIDFMSQYCTLTCSQYCDKPENGECD